MNETLNSLSGSPREAHIIALCLEHDINYTIGPNRSPRAIYPRTGDKRASAAIVIKPIRGQVSYFVALHELGHILGHGRGLVRLEEEALAWRWAFANTEEEPSIATYRSIRRRLESYFARALRWSNMTLPGEGSEFHRLLSWLVEITEDAR